MLRTIILLAQFILLFWRFTKSLELVENVGVQPFTWPTCDDKFEVTHVMTSVLIHVRQLGLPFLSQIDKVFHAKTFLGVITIILRFR